MKILILLAFLASSSIVQCSVRMRRHTGPHNLIYMTFDDGPGAGTLQTLDVLKEFKISATFFVNGIHLDTNNRQALTERRQLIHRIVQEGHMIGDHSYNHMKNNTPDGSPNNVYKTPEEDILYFGLKNVEPVARELKAAGLDNQTLSKVSFNIAKHVRMPYTANWRVGDIVANCVDCTLPVHISGKAGVALADLMHKRGVDVIGWDTEFAIDWRKPGSRYAHDGAEMMRKVENVKPQSPGKIVVLSHDRAHRPGGGVSELTEFFKLALAKGYQFRTIDTYETDKPVGARTVGAETMENYTPDKPEKIFS